MKKKLLILIGLMINASIIYPNQQLIVSLQSGVQVTFPLSEEPTIVITDSVVTIQTQNYAFDDLGKYTIGENFADELIEIEGGKNISIQGGWLYISSLANESSIQLFTVLGQEMPFTSHSTDKGLVINIQALPRGIYLLNIGSETIKFQRR